MGSIAHHGMTTQPTSGAVYLDIRYPVSIYNIIYIIYIIYKATDGGRGYIDRDNKDILIPRYLDTGRQTLSNTYGIRRTEGPGMLRCMVIPALPDFIGALGTPGNYGRMDTKENKYSIDS